MKEVERGPAARKVLHATVDMPMTAGLVEVLEDHSRVIAAINGDEVLLGNIMDAARRVTDAIARGNKLMTCGNGGSAADAQHIAAELVGRFQRERRALPAEALTTNVSALTAIANDYSFDAVFSRQVEANGRDGDVLIGISTSGSSKNVLKAFAAAREMNIATILLTGSDVEESPEGVDLVIRVPSPVTARIQEAHILIGHYICEHAERELAGKAETPGP